jgi:nucleoside-diphosphate-sugar epimerase
MATAFVTGGSGFIGGRLIERLVKDGHAVKALARSDAAAARVAELGAEPARGDLSDVDGLVAAAGGAEIAYHSAAWTGPGGSWADFEKSNVDGTRNVLDACRTAGVRRLVHVGTEAALMAGEPLVNVDETAPLRPDSRAPYPATKAAAEQLVRSAKGLETVVVRPRLVWGRGDTNILPTLVTAVRSGQFAWLGGGRQLTATTHVDNTVEGLVLAAERGRPGEAYFVTDGDPVVFRDFLTELLATQGVTIPGRSIPLGVAKVLVEVLEGGWKVLRRPGLPPLNRFLLWASGQECTINIGKARAELGYAPVISRDEGFTQLRTQGE